MSHRRQQLESTLQRTIGQIISAGLADPRVSGLISVTGVNITPDGQLAIISISVLPEDRQETVLHGLRHATRHIHAEVAEKVYTRSLPKFRFELDTSLKKQAAVLDAIRQAAAELPPPPEEPEEDEAADEATFHESEDSET
ncbi:30S ribosome-binding factor RbfA [Planctomycetales bacterium ZRK34]|nr:30S ribosome-binding factor RbfA [Planctomycetales bacterium ZRK34]